MQMTAPPDLPPWMTTPDGSTFHFASYAALGAKWRNATTVPLKREFLIAIGSSSIFKDRRLYRFSFNTSDQDIDIASTYTEEFFAEDTKDGIIKNTTIVGAGNHKSTPSPHHPSRSPLPHPPSSPSAFLFSSRFSNSILGWR